MIIARAFRLLKDCLDAANAGGAGFFFLDFEMTENAGMFDVRTAADFARDGVFEVADGVDFEFFGVFVPELTVSFEGVFGVSFVVFGEDDGEVLFNPVVDLVFDGFDFFRCQFVVAVEVEAHAVGRDVAAFLAHVLVDMFLKGGEAEVSGGVIFGGLLPVVFEATFEHAFAGGFATFALFL